MLRYRPRISKKLYHEGFNLMMLGILVIDKIILPGKNKVYCACVVEIQKHPYIDKISMLNQRGFVICMQNLHTSFNDRKLCSGCYIVLFIYILYIMAYKTSLLCMRTNHRIKVHFYQLSLTSCLTFEVCKLIKDQNLLILPKIIIVLMGVECSGFLSHMNDCLNRHSDLLLCNRFLTKQV